MQYFYDMPVFSKAAVSALCSCSLLAEYRSHLKDAVQTISMDRTLFSKICHHAFEASYARFPSAPLPKSCAGAKVIPFRSDFTLHLSKSSWMVATQSLQSST